MRAGKAIPARFFQATMAVMNEKQKPERTPENKAMTAPENKQLKFPLPKRKAPKAETTQKK